jgi:hypothetical protein
MTAEWEELLLSHGALELPSVRADSHKLELEGKAGFIGDPASQPSGKSLTIGAGDSATAVKIRLACPPLRVAGYDGGYDTVRRYAAARKHKHEYRARRCLRAADICVRRGVSVRLVARDCRCRAHAGCRGSGFPSAKAPARLPAPLPADGMVHRGPGLLMQARCRSVKFPARSRSAVEAIYGTGALAKGLEWHHRSASVAMPVHPYDAGWSVLPLHLDLRDQVIDGARELQLAARVRFAGALASLPSAAQR